MIGFITEAPLTSMEGRSTSIKD
jgi:hypothetical protein